MPTTYKLNSDKFKCDNWLLCVRCSYVALVHSWMSFCCLLLLKSTLHSWWLLKSSIWPFVWLFSVKCKIKHEGTEVCAYPLYPLHTCDLPPDVTAGRSRSGAPALVTPAAAGCTSLWRGPLRTAAGSGWHLPRLDWGSAPVCQVPERTPSSLGAELLTCARKKKNKKRKNKKHKVSVQK